MRRSTHAPLAAALLGLAGCVTAAPAPTDRAVPAIAAPAPAVVQAAHVAPVAAPAAGFALPDLVSLAAERNPRLARVGWAVETARGRAVQAGLYPNPVVSFTGDELGDRTGPAGIWTAPLVTQEIVSGNKLGLSRAVALKEVDQAALAAIAERYRLFTDVRQNYFDVLTLQRRAELLRELVGLAEQSVAAADKLRRAGEAARLDVVQLEVDRERYRAELEAAERGLPAAFRRLAASAGAPDLPVSAVAGSLDAPPADLDLDRVRAYVVAVHPELRSAQVGVERAQLAVRRAEAEPVPNVTLGAGYVRQSQNRSDDWVVSASLPVPLWNKNQGGVFAAKAQVGEALAEAGRVQNDLSERVAAAFGTYAAARRRAERYRTAILPLAEETYKLSLTARAGGQLDSLKVLQAQRAVAEARLETVRSLGEMWRAAADLAGLMLEDDWPAK